MIGDKLTHFDNLVDKDFGKRIETFKLRPKIDILENKNWQNI